MSGSYVLDTSVLLHLIRGKALGIEIDEAFGLTTSMHRQVVSIVTQAELWVMAERRNWGAAKRNALQNALDNLVVLSIEGHDFVQAYVSISRAEFAAEKVLGTWERMIFGLLRRHSTQNFPS